MSVRSTALKTARAAAAALIFAGGFIGTGAGAQTLAGASTTRQNAYSQAISSGEGIAHVNLSATGATSQVLSLGKGKSAIVDLPVDVRDAMVANPAIADAVLRGSRRVMILGMAAGQTDAVFFDAAGRRILGLDIRVGVDTGSLNDTLARLIPGSQIRVESVNNSVVLTGQVPNSQAAEQAASLAASYVGDPRQVVNMLSIAGKDQVMLKVQIVEVQRNIIKQLGFDMSSVYNRVGEPQYMFGNSASFGVNGGLLGGLTGGVNLDTTTQPIGAPPANCQQANNIDASNQGNCVGTDRIGSSGLNQAKSMVKAFERVGLIRTLAEPNLTAISGESAKFLAGGEYPVPTGRDISGNVTIEFKPYGVGLGFTPVVLSGGRISLRISTEVSELTTNGSFTLTGTAGNTTIPALNVRRAETTVELPSGGSMMIAGLLQDSTKQNIDSLPGVTNLPVLGALFRSRDYLKGETELVVMVTPYIVQPTSPNRLQTPADGLKIANDLDTVLMGKLNKAYGTKEAGVRGRTYQGPYGYVIE